MKNILVLLLIFFFIGCTTERKASNFYDNHKDKLAEKCATNFPVRDSVVTKDSTHFDTLYIAGEPVILRDSFYLKGDTIVRVITKECPKEKTIVKTVTNNVDHYIENTARVKVLENAIANDNKVIQKQVVQIEGLMDKVKGKNKVIWWLIIYSAALTIWTFRKPLLRLINPIKAIPPIG